LYATNDGAGNWSAITEADWLLEVYDLLLKEWLALLTTDPLQLANTKPGGYTDDAYDVNDADGYPGPTINCLWDELTSFVTAPLSEKERRDFAYPETKALEQNGDSWSTADQEALMLAWYLQQLSMRFDQVFSGDEFTIAEDDEWQRLLVEVRDYPDWADAAHIAAYE